MADVGTAYVQVVPSAKGISGSISKVLGGEADAAGVKAGGVISGRIGKFLVGAGIGTALGAGLAKSLTEGAKLEQSIGGIETLFKESSDQMIKYADQAYKTAGVSANEYMEQATSFSASLLQSTGGDTEKAAKAANQAIIDMSDNANKMGTDIGSIQNAYQGFAKQNYTMLDNLKLGYGGTKTEMERLLSDAEKISGQEYDISNLSDVYEAIHVIQGELDITGTTSKEAASTLSGSFASMQSAATNLLGDLTLGRNLEPAMIGLAESAGTFLFGNLVPAVGNVFRSLPVVAVTMVRQGIPAFTSAGTDLMNGIIDGVGSEGPKLLEELPGLVDNGLGLVSEYVPIAMSKGGDLIVGLANGVLSNAPAYISTAADVVDKFPDFLEDLLPKMGTQGGRLIARLAVGLVKNGPSLLAATAKLGLTITSNIFKLGPILLKTGGNLILSLARGLGGAALSSVKSAMGRIGSALTKPIDSAKGKISGAIGRIKGLFPIRVGNIFSGLKLPHFSVSGGVAPFGIGGKGSLPKLSVSWYRKAMDEPYLFDKPTLFGAGDVSDEMLYGRSNLMSDIKDAVGGGVREIVNYFTINETDNAEEVATEVIYRIRQELAVTR